MLFAVGHNESLARTITDAVNKEIGWEDDLGVHRNVIDNQAVVVRCSPRGDWSLQIGGQDRGYYADPEAAKTTAMGILCPEAVMADGAVAAPAR